MTTTMSFQRTRTRFVSMTRRVLTASLFATFAFVATFAFGKNDAPEAPSPSSVPNVSESDVESNDDAFPGFRFWKAPVDLIDRWPWGREKYYPIKIEQFERWLDVTDEIARLKDEERIVRGIAPSLTLKARLSGDALSGVGEFSTERVRPDDYDDSVENESTPYLLRPFSFAISPYSSEEKVDLGEAVGAYPDGRFYLPNSKAISRKFLWSQRGTLDRRGRLTFDFRLPGASRAELILDAPVDVAIEAVDGFVAEIPTESESVEQPVATRRWRVYFGGRPRGVLRATRGADFSKGARRIGTRQENSYRLTREGLELNARLEFERSAGRPEEVVLFLDKRLRLISAEWGAVKELRLESTSFDDQTNKIVIKTPGQLESLDDLKLTAFGRVELGKTSPLPSLTFEEGAAFYWRETTTRLAVVRPLVASSSSLTDAFQFREAFRARQEGVEVLSYKLNNSKGTVALNVCSLEKDPPFDSATDCLIDANDVSAKTTLFYSFNGIERSDVAIPIAPYWSIRTASSLSDDLVSWSFDDKETPETETRVLRVSFKKTPPADRPVRIDLTARMVKSDADAPIDVDKLCPVDLSKNLRGAHALALRAESPYQVKLTTRSGRPYEESKTDPDFVFSELALRDALPSSLGGKRFYFGAQTVDAAVSLENLRATYSASGTCRCDFYGTVVPDSYIENWDVHCEPLGGSSVGRVVFYVPGALEGTKAYNAVWKWSSSLEPGRLNTAARLSAEDAKIYHIPEKTAAYEMRLPSFSNLPFDLKMTREDAFSKRAQPFLPIFPESSNSSLEVVVDSPQGFRFETHFANMRESTVPAAVGDEYESLKKAFRYESNAGRRDAGFEPKRNDAVSGIVGKEESSSGTESADPELTVSFENAAVFDEQPDATLLPSARCWFERLDSFIQTNGKSRNRALFYVENRGRFDFELKLPTNVGENAIRNVWVDGRDATYDYLRDKRSILTPLPTDRRFICVAVEYDAPGARLAGGERLTPSRMTSDEPVLSGEWNVWTPPQYQTRPVASADRIDERVVDSGTSSFFSWMAPRVSERRIKELSDRFLERFGNGVALTSAVAESKKIGLSDDSSVVPPKPSSSSGALTWGDVVGNPVLVNWLFAPLAKDASQNDESRASNATNTPFGVLDASASFSLYVDRAAAASASFAPSTPLSGATLTSYESRARQTIENAKLALVFIDDKTAVLTSRSALDRRFDASTASIDGSCVFRVNKASDVRKARSELASDSRRFVVSQEWRDSEAISNPWRDAPRDEFAVGWNRTNVSLNRAELGVRVVNRYFLWALELFCFIGYAAILWRFNLAGIRLCVGTLGACAAALNVVAFELFAATLGVAYGALFVLCYLVFIPRGAFKTDRAGRVDRNRARDVDRANGKTLEVEFSNSIDETSSEGFVDFNLMPSEERRRLRGDDRKDALPTPETPDEFRSGTISMKTALALTLTVLVLVVFARRAYPVGQEPPVSATSSAVSTETPNESARDDDSTWREPYRVFAPVDENGDAVGDYYWVGSEFYETIRSTLAQSPRERNWRVVDARYEGSLNYDASTGATTMFNLKATYSIVMDSTSATIVLPAIPLAPDSGAKFDNQTISSSYDEQADELYFNPYDVEPGEHSLELTIVPQQFPDSNTLLSIPVLKSPSARLELSASLDAPKLDAPDAMGKTSRGAGWFVAELGAVDRLTVTLQDPADSLVKGSVDVEQLFLARPRATQLDVRAVFRRSTPGARVKTLEIDCDPSYSFSGTCAYDEGEIESVEPPTDQDGTLRVTFKEATTEPFTLNVGFIARNFSGVGCVQYPRISLRDVRAFRNWFAVSPGSDVVFSTEPEYSRPSMLDAFKKAWGTVDDTIASAYDLSSLPRGATFSIGAKISAPTIDSTTLCVFDVSEIRTSCDALIQAPNDLFRLSARIPTPFSVDSIALTDERGTALEQPDFFTNADVLTIVFQNPVKGRVNLRIVGRTKTFLGEKRVFPSFEFLQPHEGERFARLYRAPGVFFEWNDSKGWILSESSDSESSDAPSGDYRFVGLYKRVGEFAGLSDPSAYSYANEKEDPTVADVPVSDDALCVARVNAPRFTGVEETALYHELNSPLWRAKVYFRFSVESGVADRFLILDDEAFSWEIEDVESRFDVAEATTYFGGRAISLTPKKPLGNPIDIRLVATFKNDPDAIRLPKFQLAPSSLREDVSGVERYVALPERKMTDRQNERLNWTIRDLDEVVDDSTRSSVNKATGSIVSSIAKESAFAVDKLKKELLDDLRNITGGLTDYEFSFYHREPTASAKLLSADANLSASRASYSFYMNARDEYFGSASFMIRKNSANECALLVPRSCELLEVTVNGSRRFVERVGSNGSHSFWRVDLDSTPYVKLVEASFRGSSRLSPNVQAVCGSRRTPAFCADFIVVGEKDSVENVFRKVKPERVYWTCAFESLDVARTRWRVFGRGDESLEAPPSRTEFADAEREPILWSDAGGLLYRFRVEEASALLEAYESDLSQLSGENADDLPRLRARWDLAWRENQSAVAQFARSPEETTARWRRATHIAEKGVVVNPEDELADPTSRWGRSQYEETTRQKSKLDEAYSVESSTSDDAAFVASPQSLWTYDAGSSTRLLFGVSDGETSRVIVASTPKSFDFFASRYSTAAFILVLTAFFMSFLKKRGAKRSAFRSFYAGLFVAVWTVVFFLLDRKQIGLLGALVFAVGPAFVASSYRRLKARFGRVPASVPEEPEQSSIEPDLFARRYGGGELSTTESLGTPVAVESTEAAQNFGSETQLSGANDDETSFDEQFD